MVAAHTLSHTATFHGIKTYEKTIYKKYAHLILKQDLKNNVFTVSVLLCHVSATGLDTMVIAMG